MTCELSELGQVYTTDVLIIGGGMGGMVCGLKLKHLDPTIDVLCVEKDYHGYCGQSTKAGHGISMIAPEDDTDAFCKEQVETNNFGMYLNDQDYLYQTTEEQRGYLQELEELGGVFAHNPDGSFHHHREFATKKGSSSNIDMDVMVPYGQQAIAHGVRVLERTYFTDLLTTDGAVVGAVGFNIDSCEFVIMRAKAVVLACNCFNPAVTGMFYLAATGTIAAWEAGAQLRNPELATYCDLGFRNTKNFMYGVHWVICNKHGENLFQKYHAYDFENIDIKLMRGMAKEVREGNWPLYIDFKQLPDTSETEGEGFNMGMVMPLRIDLDNFLLADQQNRFQNPEISLTMYVYSESLRVDIDTRTTVPNLYGIGSIGAYGSAWGGWVHGDGVGYAGRTGLHCAKVIAPGIHDVELGEVDPGQVERFKQRVYAPTAWAGEALPYEVIHYLDRLICCPENSIDKTEESIHAVLDELARIKGELPQLIHVPEGDGHHLFKAVEARTMLDMLQIMFMAYDMRKESRGFHMRADYPERDDANYLKRITVERNEDGTPRMGWERIPFENYKWKPDGFSPDWPSQKIA